MEHPLSGPAGTIVLIFVGFIVAINLSLVFAFLHRNRDAEQMRRPRIRQRAPWESKLTGPSEELSRKVAELRDQHLEGDQPDTKPPSSS